MVYFVYRFRFIFLALGFTGICPVWAQESGSAEMLAEALRDLEEETERQKMAPPKRRRGRSSTSLRDLTPIDRLRYQRE